MTTLTVFTPTFNRAHTLPAVFASLMRQTSRDFKWLIIDDGSTDATRDLVERWRRAADFEVDYLFQQNAGKHNAHNAAVQRANTELLAVLDSDDELLPEGVSTIVNSWHAIPRDLKNGGADAIVGLWTLCEDGNGRLFGSKLPRAPIDATLQELRYAYGIAQEMFPCFATAVLRQYPFPTTPPGFCAYIPEGYVWSQITQKHRLRFVNIVCRHSNLDPGGLTAGARFEYRVSRSVVYGYLQPLTSDIAWLTRAPLSFVSSAIQAGRYAIFSRQFIELWRPLGWKAKALLLAASPVAMLLLLRDLLTGRIARQMRTVPSKNAPQPLQELP